MDRYLAKQQPLQRTLALSAPQNKQAAATSKMADGLHIEDNADHMQEGESSCTPPNAGPLHSAPIDYTALASAVAAVLKPDITATVSTSINSHMASLQSAIEAQSNRLQAMDMTVSDFAVDPQRSQDKLHSTIQYLQDKVDDLENRSHRNNLRFIGIPESVKSAELATYCSATIPQALGVDRPCKVERAHRIGPPRDDSKPCPVIARSPSSSLPRPKESNY